MTQYTEEQKKDLLLVYRDMAMILDAKGWALADVCKKRIGELSKPEPKPRFTVTGLVTPNDCDYEVVDSLPGSAFRAVFFRNRAAANDLAAFLNNGIGDSR